MSNLTTDPTLDEEIKAMHDADPCPPESNCTICYGTGVGESDVLDDVKCAHCNGTGRA